MCLSPSCVWGARAWAGTWAAARHLPSLALPPLPHPWRSPHCPEDGHPHLCPRSVWPGQRAFLVLLRTAGERCMQDLGHHWDVAVPGISPDFIPTANILVLGAAEFCPSEVRELHGWANTCPSVGSRIGELEGVQEGLSGQHQGFRGSREAGDTAAAALAGLPPSRAGTPLLPGRLQVPHPEPGGGLQFCRDTVYKNVATPLPRLQVPEKRNRSCGAHTGTCLFLSARVTHKVTPPGQLESPTSGRCGVSGNNF